MPTLKCFQVSLIVFLSNDLKIKQQLLLLLFSPSPLSTLWTLVTDSSFKNLKTSFSGLFYGKHCSLSKKENLTTDINS